MEDKSREGAGAPVVLWIIGVLCVASAIALSTVKHPGVLTVASVDPTPQGYTWSLAFFLLPIGVIVAWLHLFHDKHVPRIAFWVTIAILAPLGFILDTVFGLLFFNFRNQGATLGIRLYALDWDARAFARLLPLEEFGFYLFGFIAMLASYLWLDEHFLRRYNREDYEEALVDHGPVLRFHWPSLAVAAVLVAASLAFKHLGPVPEGFPGWMVFLIVVGITPSIGLFRSTAPFLNWRAFAVTSILMALVSVMWEATLAVPYGWWGYNNRQMVGVFVGAWSGLPLEQPVLWVLIPFATMIVFETVKIVLHMKRAGHTTRSALLGGPST